MHACETTTCPCRRFSDACVAGPTRSRTNPGVNTEWYVPTPIVSAGSANGTSMNELGLYGACTCTTSKLRSRKNRSARRPPGITVCSVCEPFP
jgi:hypothetical protein